nr:MAG TPA: immunity protein [Caudoviricetes sp.]
MEFIVYYSETGELISHGAPTGVYKSRYYAKKQAKSTDVVVKVDGGYTIMDCYDYKIWRGQK